MPIPEAISTAAVSFKYNADFLKKNIAGLTDEEWTRKPEGGANDILWIVGHICWARAALLKCLGEDLSKPWFAHFGRGAKPGDAVAYPTAQDAMSAWDESVALLTAAMESASAEAMAAPATSGPPSADGKVSGIVNFLAYHETYHIGQASYLRGWLGHPGIMG